MFWLGGFRGPSPSRRVPQLSHQTWPNVADCWLVGSPQGNSVLTARTAKRSIAIVGSCGATEADVLRLATHGVSDDVARRWPGAYVVVEDTDDATTVWTDLGGVWPIYTVTADGGVFWSSSSRALAALTVHQIDSHRLAIELLAPAAARLARDRSMFAGVSLVPSGHRAVMTNSGGLEVQPVWQPGERSGNHQMRLRAELSMATALRVENAENPTVDLSGGLDSTALALLAAEKLCPDRTITGVTVHAPGPRVEGDLSYAHEAGMHPGITHEFMPIGMEHLPYSALDTVPVTDEPAPSTVAYTRFAGQLDWMRDRFGTDSHMTGDGGDSLLRAEPIMLADLVASRRFHRAAADAIAWARLRRVAMWPVLGGAISTARTSRSSALQALAHTWRTGRSADTGSTSAGVTWFPAVPQPSWATQEARELAASLATSIAAQSVPTPSVGFTPFVTAEAMAAVGRTARADVQLAEHHGVPLHNPFMDSRVIDAYLSIPLEVRPGPADYKTVLRGAMGGLFSPALANRTTKGSFTSDFYQGMRTNLAALHELADGYLVVLGLIHPSRFRQVLTAAAAGVPGAFESVDAAIGAEVWLRTLHAATPVVWSNIQPSEETA